MNIKLGTKVWKGPGKREGFKLYRLWGKQISECRPETGCIWFWPTCNFKIQAKGHLSKDLNMARDDHADGYLGKRIPMPGAVSANAQAWS